MMGAGESQHTISTWLRNHSDETMKKHNPDQEAVKKVFDFFKLMNFPGIRQGEGNQEIYNYFKSIQYNRTPDLIAGPDKFEEVSIDDLFFIDVNEPTIDNLFKIKIADSSELFYNLLKRLKENKDFSLDEIPSIHHDNYLKAMNAKKVMKYCNRKEGTVSKNFGMVHHFNFGEIKNRRIQDSEKFFLFVDFLKFYGKLHPPQSNIDISNIYGHIVNKIFDENVSDPNDPDVYIINRDWQDTPCFFILAHINVIKKDKLRHFALWMINTSHFCDISINRSYPIHNFFRKIVYDHFINHFIKGHGHQLISSEEYENVEIPQIRLAPVTFFTKENGIKKQYND